MSKKNKGNKENLPPIPKYQNEHMIEDLGGKFRSSNEEIDRLKNKLSVRLTDLKDKSERYIIKTNDVTHELEKTEKSNAFLTNEITEIKKNQESFELECQRRFEEKFNEVQEEKRKAIDKALQDRENMRLELVAQTKETDDLKNRNQFLLGKIEELTKELTQTVERHREQIERLKEEHKLKLSLTTEIFENFLRNNEELLSTDLYSVYKKLKKNFDLKIKECMEFKQRNDQLTEENKMFRISIDNGDEMINECAKIQVENKKKNKQLTLDLMEKNKLIKKIKEEYQGQVDEINKRFAILNKETEAELQELRTALAIKSKELEELRYRSQIALNSRTELELFFIDALREVKKEIIEKRKRENERKNSAIFPILNSSMSSSCSTNGHDESTFVTSIKKVEIKDLDPESKEKLIRALLNKINEGKQNQNFARLRKALI